MGKIAHYTSLVKLGSQILEYEDAAKPLYCIEDVKEEDAHALFHKTKELFDEAGLEFSLAYGSLLGAVRLGKIIPGDGDMDIYIWDEEKLRENIISFYNKGLKVCRVFPGILYSYSLNIDNKNYNKKKKQAAFLVRTDNFILYILKVI